MKSSLAIVASVAVLCFAEALLLLTFGVPDMDNSVGVLNFRRGCTLLAGFLVIPGIAVLVSVLLHGLQRLGRRALRIFAVPLAVAAALIGAAALASDLEDPVGPILFLTIAVSGTVLVVVFAWKRTRKTGFQLDMVAWEDHRRSGITSAQSRRRNRIIRTSLWLPTVTVLLVFLFLPESLGIASHFIYPRARRVGDYRIPVPLTSMVAAGHDEEGLVLVALVGTGIGRDPRLVGRDFPLDFPISFWSFRTGRTRVNHEHSAMASDFHVIRFEDMQTTCSEHRPEHVWPLRHTWVFIDCEGPSGFAARLEGDAAHVEAFYDVISRTTKARR